MLISLPMRRETCPVLQGTWSMHFLPKKFSIWFVKQAHLNSSGYCEGGIDVILEILYVSDVAVKYQHIHRTKTISWCILDISHLQSSSRKAGWNKTGLWDLRGCLISSFWAISQAKLHILPFSLVFWLPLMLYKAPPGGLRSGAQRHKARGFGSLPPF